MNFILFMNKKFSQNVAFILFFLECVFSFHVQAAGDYVGYKQFGGHFDSIHADLAAAEEDVTRLIKGDKKPNIVFASVTVRTKVKDEKRHIFPGWFKIESDVDGNVKPLVFDSACAPFHEWYQTESDSFSIVEQKYAFQKELAPLVEVYNYFKEVFEQPLPIDDPTLSRDEREFRKIFHQQKENFQKKCSTLIEEEKDLQSILTQSTRNINQAVTILTSNVSSLLDFALSLGQPARHPWDNVELLRLGMFSGVTTGSKSRTPVKIPECVKAAMEGLKTAEKNLNIINKEIYSKQTPSAEDSPKNGFSKTVMHLYSHYWHSEQRVIAYLLNQDASLEAGIFDAITDKLAEYGYDDDSIDSIILHMHTRFNVCQICMPILLSNLRHALLERFKSGLHLENFKKIFLMISYRDEYGSPITVENDAFQFDFDQARQDIIHLKKL